MFPTQLGTSYIHVVVRGATGNWYEPRTRLVSWPDEDPDFVLTSRDSGSYQLASRVRAVLTLGPASKKVSGE